MSKHLRWKSRHHPLFLSVALPIRSPACLSLVLSLVPETAADVLHTSVPSERSATEHSTGVGCVEFGEKTDGARQGRLSPDGALRGKLAVTPDAYHFLCASCPISFLVLLGRSCSRPNARRSIAPDNLRIGRSCEASSNPSLVNADARKRMSTKCPTVRCIGSWCICICILGR